MNEYDTHTIESELVSGGHQLVGHPKDAELVLVNTCAIRGKPVAKVVSLLGELRKEKRSGRFLLVGMMGCLAQLEEGQEIARKFEVDILLGPGAITDILPAVAVVAADKGPFESLAFRSELGSYIPPAPQQPHRLSHHHAWLQPPLHLLHRSADQRTRGVSSRGRYPP